MTIEEIRFEVDSGKGQIKKSEDWESPDFEIPPFLRKPPPGSRECNEMSLCGINSRIEWLAARGLRPHPNVLERRAKLIDLLALPPNS